MSMDRSASQWPSTLQRLAINPAETSVYYHRAKDGSYHIVIRDEAAYLEAVNVRPNKSNTALRQFGRYGFMSIRDNDVRRAPEARFQYFHPCFIPLMTMRALQGMTRWFSQSKRLIAKDNCNIVRTRKRTRSDEPMPEVVHECSEVTIESIDTIIARQQDGLEFEFDLNEYDDLDLLHKAWRTVEDVEEDMTFDDLIGVFN